MGIDSVFIDELTEIRKAEFAESTVKALLSDILSKYPNINVFVERLKPNDTTLLYRVDAADEMQLNVIII